MKETLLIIDDDFNLVNSLQEILPSAEAEIIHTFDYRGGSKVIARQRVSAVVLNLMLPGISGFSFLEDLRINRPMPILATGSATAERVRAYLLGAGFHPLLDCRNSSSKTKILPHCPDNFTTILPYYGNTDRKDGIAAAYAMVLRFGWMAVSAYRV